MLFQIMKRVAGYFAFISGLACLAALAQSGSDVLAIEGPRVFRVRDYGALPGAPADAGDAIRRALQAARDSGGPAVVRLEAGVYRLGPMAGSTRCLSIDGAVGLTLEGEPGQTELIITDPRAEAIIVGGSRDVTIRGLTIDYDPLPFTQGRVTAVDAAGGSFDMAIDEGYPSPGEPWFLQGGKWGVIIDGQERHLKAGASDHVFFTDWALVQGNVWRLTLQPDQAGKLADMAPGDRFVLMARSGFTAVGLIDCQDCTLDGVTIYSAPALACALIGNRGRVTLRGYAVRYRPGTTRLLSTNGDGVHAQRNRVGPTIEGCLFEGMADDSINMYTPPDIVREVISPTELIASAGVPIEAGDRLQVFDPAGGRVRAEVSVTTTTVRDGQYRLQLAAPVEGVVAGQDHRDADTLYNLSACGSGYVIRGNTMRNHRRHGILLRAGGGLVEGNTIEQVAGLGIVLTNEPGWPEGPVPFGVTIRGNTITGCGYGRGYGDSPRGASVQIQGIGLDGRLARGRPVHDVTRVGNRFIDPPGAGLFIGAARNVRIEGNSIAASADAFSPRPCAVMIIEDCEGVVLEGNMIDDARAATTASPPARPAASKG